MRGALSGRRAPVAKASRRTAWFAVGAAVAVTAAVVATLINHKSGGESKQRKAVSAYIQTVNLVQSRMGVQLVRVRTAYADLSAHSGRRTRAAAELAGAVATLTKLERQLIATPAPPEAKKLRSLFVEFVAQQAALTREVHQLAVFTARFSVYITRLRVISARFGNAMRAVPKPKRKAVRGTHAQVAAAERNFLVQEKAAAAAQAGAVDTYVGAITELLQGLGTLNAPRVVAPAFAAEVQSLHDVTVTGAQLSAALRAPKRAHIADRIRAFTLAGREAASVAAQRAQIASIKAYNRRTRAIGTTQAAVQNELRRLGLTLP